MINVLLNKKLKTGDDTTSWYCHLTALFSEKGPLLTGSFVNRKIVSEFHRCSKLNIYKTNN